MAAKAESRVINMAGLVQGIVLVTFPATSTIFTSSKYYSLSSSQYGSLFLPQVAARRNWFPVRRKARSADYDQTRVPRRPGSQLDRHGVAAGQRARQG